MKGKRTHVYIYRTTPQKPPSFPYLQRPHRLIPLLPQRPQLPLLPLPGRHHLPLVRLLEPLHLLRVRGGGLRGGRLEGAGALWMGVLWWGCCVRYV